MHTKSLNLIVLVSSCFFVQSIAARCYDENEDVVGAAPTGDAPPTAEWSTEVWRYEPSAKMYIRCFDQIMDKIHWISHGGGW